MERADQASRIDNEGVFETRFNLEHDGAYQHQHYFFEKYLHNSGYVTVLGDYRPRTEKRDESPILHLLTYEGEPIRVTGTLYLPLLDLYVGYHFLKDKIRPARLLIEAQGEDVVFDIEDADWSFAKQVHIRNGRHVVFKQPTTVNHLRLEAIDKVFVDRLLHLIYGDLTTQDITYFYVGRDNDHMAEIQADAGAIDIEGHYLIDARYGKLRSQGRLRLRAPHGKIQIGEQVVVPANEVASRVKVNASELLGCASWEGHTFYQDFYLSNGSTLSSQGGQVILEAQQEINGRFATILARQGLRAVAPTIDLLSANLILLASSRLQADHLLFHRPLNREASSPWPLMHAIVQTSYVPLLMVLGDLELAVQQPVLKGVDILVSGSLIRPQSSSQTALISEAYEHKRYYTPPTAYSSSGSSFLAGFAFAICDALNRSLASRINMYGTSGGNVFFGQELRLTGDDLLVIGGGVSAQLLTVAANTLTLQALRAHLPRVALETAGLDKVAERLSQSMTTLRRTSYGGLTLKPELREGETEQAEPKTAPFWDETTQRFTPTYPTNIPFYLDNALEQIAFTEQMRVNTGRIYDDHGHSGERVVQESVRRAQELATQEAGITEQTLAETRTCLLFYRLQKINGQDFLVATAHIPQTLQEDRINASGVARAEQIHSKTQTFNSQGGRTAATGPGQAMNLETETKTAASVKVGGQTVRPTEAVERGDFRQAVTGEVTEEGLISTVAGNRSVRVDGNLTQTNCQNNAAKATTVEVGGKATLQSSSFISDKGPTYLKAAALEMETLLDTIYTHNGYYQRPRADTVLASRHAGLVVDVATDMKATGALFGGTSVDIHADGSREFEATPMSWHTVDSGKKRTTTRDGCIHFPTRIVVTQATEAAADPAPRVLGSALLCPARDSDSLTDYYENPVSGDGNDCAFNCLGTSRTEAILKLLAEKDNEEARRLVAPEILQAFLSGDIDRLPGFQGLEVYQTLKAQQHRQRWLNQFMESHGAELGLTAGHSWLDAYQAMVAQDRAEAYPEFMQAAEKYLSFMDDLQAFARDAEVYERYLYRYFDTNEMMGYLPDQYNASTGTWRRTSSAFDLLARLQGQKLRIMVKTESGDFELLHEDDFDGEPVTLLHTLAGVEGGYAAPKEATETGLNHFNVLLTYAQQQDFNRFYEHKAAEGQVYLSSGGNAFEQGLQTQALKGVTKRSGGVLVEVAIQNWMREHTVTRKRSGIGRKKNVQTTHFTLQNQGCTTVTKENDVEYYAAHGIALQASIIRARKIRLQTAEGVIKLLTALNVDCVETKKRSKDAVWQCQSQTFDYNETRLPCQFFYNEEDGIEFIAPEGIVVELVQEKHSRADGDVDKGKPREWHRFKDYSTQPGYEWMKLLDARDDVIRIYVDEHHDSEAASWTKQLQEAFCESLKTGMANTVASGLVYGNWREQLKEAGINLVTDTAAHFGAAQIGGKRLEQIEADLKAGKTDIFNYVSHKVTHAALGAATRAAAAEIVAEQMMPKTINSIETQLGEEGLRSGTRRYFERKQELLSTELIRIKAYGQIAAVLTAKAVGGDIHAAQEAAINAMTFNTTQVYEGVLQSNDPDDLFAAMVEAQLEEEEEENLWGDKNQELEQEQYADRRSSSSTSKSHSKGKEKAVDENDYEDLEETDSFITENIDTQFTDKNNFQNLMWHIAEEEPRGRSRTREPRSSSSQGNSPPRDQKASFEKFRRMMSDTRDFLYEGQARFRNGERNVKTFLRAHGADWLDTLGYAAKAVDFVSGGTFSKAGELMGQASQSANTSIRRGLRDLTGNATFAQETADYIMLVAEMVTPGTAAKAMKVGGASKIASRSRLAALDLAGVNQGSGTRKSSTSLRNAEKQQQSRTSNSSVTDQKGLLHTEFSKNVRAYIHDMETRSGIKFTKEQKDHLAEALRNNEFNKLSADAAKKHKAPYKNPELKKKLKQEWTQNTDQDWLKSSQKNKRTGMVEEVDHQFHHIIPQELGGPHTWWNGVPIKAGDHQGGIHGTGSPLKEVLKQAQ
ncbi:HNH endonuclease [Candidatus Odyssella thessalonicensis]|uniref:HNH endonuclease n=1 Tax=Candidatus Odyssella thessalonicensis TaxID=84647 RepID=UPI000225BFC7|nr:hypothetical protein [Candidatus Odyssella thessalonicensis]